ncbi:formate/nitrite transporter family protein [Peribacillus sp. SCS-155]|uniref:formate/nitrite transporter family protein n=1 Tax=Peribacillus sedimenti TaxID=3115297 RepID=UPI003906B533
MAFHSPQQVAQKAVEAGVRKASLSLLDKLLLGFLGGAFISLGYLLDIRVIASLPAEWGTLASFIGAAVFPLGLILIIIAGGELLTGNMMAVAIAVMAKKVKVSSLINNWFWITIANFLGAIFVAYFFGHVAGLTAADPFLHKVIAVAEGKLEPNFIQALVSAIGCNWLVCLAVWMSYTAEDIGGKILAIWWPIMGFVAIGFQHVVANMFIIPAAIFEGHFSWMDYLSNFVPVFIGNAIGGAIFVGLIYYVTYLRQDKKAVK